MTPRIRLLMQEAKLLPDAFEFHSTTPPFVNITTKSNILATDPAIRLECFHALALQGKSKSKSVPRHLPASVTAAARPHNPQPEA